MMTNEMVDMIVKMVIGIASVLITSYLIPWIKAKLGSTKYNDCVMFINKCVQAANQLYTPEQWANKKTYVVSVVQAYAKNHGVDITSEEIDTLIEGIVREVKVNGN